MNKNILILILISLILVGTFLVGRYIGFRGVIEVKDTIAPKIEKYYLRNDSLLRINDSINLKVIEIERTYEKTVDDIIRNNPHDDYNFFSDYIERYCGRYYSDSAQNSKFNIR